MRTLSHKAGLHRNGFGLPVSSLPLFAWADAESIRAHFPETCAARAIARRYRVSTALARAIAELASIGGQA